MNSFDVVPALAQWVPMAWWMAVAVLLLGCAVQWRRGRRTWWLLVACAALILVSRVWLSTAIDAQAAAAASQAIAAKPLSPESQAVFSIVAARCQACHSDHATLMPWAAFGLSLNDMDDVERNATPIYKQVVELQAMPMGNATQMTAEERAAIARWYAARPH